MKAFRIGFTEDGIEKGIPISCYYGAERLPKWSMVLGGDENFKIVPLAPDEPQNNGQFYRIAEALEPVVGGGDLFILEEDLSPCDALALVRARELTSGKFSWVGEFRKFEEFPGEVLLWEQVEEDLLPVDDLLVVIEPETLFRVLSSQREEQYYYWSGEAMVRTIPEV